MKRDHPSDEGAVLKAKSKKKRQDQPSSGSKEWRPVETGEDFMTGLDEDGFMGLEEMDSPMIFSLGAQPPGNAAAENGSGTAATAAAGAPTSAAKAGKKASNKAKSKPLPVTEAQVEESAATQPPSSSAPVASGTDAVNGGGSVIVPEAAAELKQGAAKQLERVRAQQERSKQKLAAAKAKVETEKAASGAFVMPEGLSRKEQKKLLADQKRARHKAAQKHKKAKIAERRRRYKDRKAARDRGDAGESSGSEDEGASKPSPTSGKAADAAELDETREAAGPSMAAWDVFGLHPAMVGALARQGFTAPTPIQEACLMPAISGRRDIIGAAQTGLFVSSSLSVGQLRHLGRAAASVLRRGAPAPSPAAPDVALSCAEVLSAPPTAAALTEMPGCMGSGKTLAFGLPILQRLVAGGGGAPGLPDRSPLPPSDLRCLVLLPTRELALQVEQHLRVIARPCGISTAALVGGLSAVKQERVLGRRPAVVAATPGRLWDLMSGGAAAGGGGSSGGRAAPHLARLGALDFLVLDEADRMVQQGHFQDLGNIIAYITANRGGASGSTRDDPSSAAPALGGASSGSASASDSDSDPGRAEERSDSDAGSGGGEHGGGEQGGAEGGRRRGGGPVPLQTFVFSATLTLPENLRRRLRKGGGGAGGGTSSLDNLMDAVPFGPRPKVVDLTSDTQRLASRLQEAVLKCDRPQRDELLYYILVRHPGRTLVFVNAITMTLRVTKILAHLGLPAIALHAGQQQRQRLKALDRFRQQPNGVLVATDVAARGLDVDNIRCVVHYDIPASADLYVHRSGRTARAAQGGVAVALVTPEQSRTWDRLLAALGHPPASVPPFPVEETLLPACKKRVAMAVQLDKVVHADSKQNADHKWMLQAAADLGVQLSEGEMDRDTGEITRGRKRRELERRMKKAGRRPECSSEELAGLLAEPLRAGFSQKYFTGGAAGAAAVLATAAPASIPGAEAPAGAGMGAVVGMAAALQKSRTDAAASQEGARAAAAKRTRREKKRQAASMLLHTAAAVPPADAAPASDAAAAAVPHATEPSTADEAAAAAPKSKRKQRSRGCGSSDRSGGDGADSATGKPAKKRQRGQAVPVALGRDAGGEDAVAALNRSKH